MDTVNKNNLNYFAGLFDGEGSVMIKRFKRNGKVDYTICISIGMSNKLENAEVLELFQKTFGGHLYRYTQHFQNTKRLDTIQWSATAHKCFKFITLIKPYLRIKNKQCEIAIQFSKGLNKKNDPTPLSKEERIKRENLFYKLRELNVKGQLRLQRLNEETAKADVIV